MPETNEDLGEICENAQGTEDRLYKALQLATRGKLSEAARTEVTAHLLQTLPEEAIVEITNILSKTGKKAGTVLSER